MLSSVFGLTCPTAQQKQFDPLREKFCNWMRWSFSKLTYRRPPYAKQRTDKVTETVLAETLITASFNDMSG